MRFCGGGFHNERNTIEYRFPAASETMFELLCTGENVSEHARHETQISAINRSIAVQIASHIPGHHVPDHADHASKHLASAHCAIVVHIKICQDLSGDGDGMRGSGVTTTWRERVRDKA